MLAPLLIWKADVVCARPLHICFFFLCVFCIFLKILHNWSFSLVNWGFTFGYQDCFELFLGWSIASQSNSRHHRSPGWYSCKDDSRWNRIFIWINLSLSHQNLLEWLSASKNAQFKQSLNKVKADDLKSQFLSNTGYKMNMTCWAQPSSRGRLSSMGEPGDVR